MLPASMFHKIEFYKSLPESGLLKRRRLDARRTSDRAAILRMAVRRG